MERELLHQAQSGGKVIITGLTQDVRRLARTVDRRYTTAFVQAGQTRLDRPGRLKHPHPRQPLRERSTRVATDPGQSGYHNLAQSPTAPDHAHPDTDGQRVIGFHRLRLRPRLLTTPDEGVPGGEGHHPKLDRR